MQGAQYNAAKGKDGLYNFVGLVLGHHGTTIQRLQRGSGAKIEIHRSAGNLNGDHPALDDTSLHALVQADTKVPRGGVCGCCWWWWRQAGAGQREEVALGSAASPDSCGTLARCRAACCQPHS